MRNIAGSSAQMTKNINIENLRPGLVCTGLALVVYLKY